EILVDAPNCATRRCVQTIAAPSVVGVDLPLVASASVEGVVLDDRGAPLAGARIVVGDGEACPASTTSAADGRFRLDGFPVDGSLTCSAPGRAPVTLGPRIAGSTALEFRLAPGGRVHGVVRGPVGAVVEGAVVTATCDDRRATAVSDAAGRFAFG